MPTVLEKRVTLISFFICSGKLQQGTSYFKLRIKSVIDFPEITSRSPNFSETSNQPSNCHNFSNLSLKFRKISEEPLNFSILTVQPLWLQNFYSSVLITSKLWHISPLDFWIVTNLSYDFKKFAFVLEDECDSLYYEFHVYYYPKKLSIQT